jgi:hypothetical protein
VEGNPTCADSSWSLWKGRYGNGFCCEVGLIGAYSASGSTAGSCAASVPADQTSAVLVSKQHDALFDNTVLKLSVSM